MLSSFDKFVEVLAGFYTDSKENEKGETVNGIFTVKFREIVRESDLAVFMRRNPQICGMPVIHLKNTNRRPENELPIR